VFAQAPGLLDGVVLNWFGIAEGNVMQILELDVFGKGAEFDHIGVAVKKIREGQLKDLDIVSDDTQNVTVGFVEINGVRIELIEPLGENSPVDASLEKGQRLVHLCYAVPDIEAAIEHSREFGFHCIQKPVPATAFGDNHIAWLFSRTYGLVELVER
jgi:methylmalonyl-CoA/ethylmalonyl-CoA epimerase